MSEIYECSRVIKGRELAVRAEVTGVGSDLCVIVTGGECPHIGCVCISQARKSMASDAGSCTTSTFNFLGHKDDAVGSRFSRELSSHFGMNVVALCGIHVDNITAAEIEAVLEMSNELIEIIKSGSGEAGPIG